MMHDFSETPKLFQNKRGEKRDGESNPLDIDTARRRLEILRSIFNPNTRGRKIWRKD
jgi:hypothetical protein